MALNPPIGDDQIPMALSGEYYLLSRLGIRLSLSIPGYSKIDGKGMIYVTTRRIVFVARKPIHSTPSPVSAFEIRYELLSDEKFNQPIFGANYLSGKARPVPGLGLPGTAKFKLHFYEGGAACFLRIFFMMMEQAHAYTAEQRRRFNMEVASGEFFRQANAFVDRSDPSQFFRTQPTTVARPVAEPRQQAGATAGSDVPVAQVVATAPARGSAEAGFQGHPERAPYPTPAPAYPPPQQYPPPPQQYPPQQGGGGYRI